MQVNTVNCCWPAVSSGGVWRVFLARRRLARRRREGGQEGPPLRAGRTVLVFTFVTKSSIMLYCRPYSYIVEYKRADARTLRRRPQTVRRRLAQGSPDASPRAHQRCAPPRLRRPAAPPRLRRPAAPPRLRRPMTYTTTNAFEPAGLEEIAGTLMHHSELCSNVNLFSIVVCCIFAPSLALVFDIQSAFP